MANAGSHAGVSEQYGHDALLYIQSHDAHAKPTPVQALLASYPRFGSDLTAAHVAKLEERQIEVQGRTLDMQLHALYIFASDLLSGHRSVMLKSAGDFFHINLVRVHTTINRLEAMLAAVRCYLERRLLAAHCNFIGKHQLLKDMVAMLESWLCILQESQHTQLVVSQLSCHPMLPSRRSKLQGIGRCRRSSQSTFAVVQLLSMPCSLRTVSALMR